MSRKFSDITFSNFMHKRKGRFPNLVKKHENESQNLVLNKFVFPKLFFTPI